MNSNQNQNADADECEDCGTTENVVELTDPEFGGVVGYACEGCIEENVAEIEDELEQEAQEAAEAFEGVEVKSDGNLSPTASHVRRVVEETFRDFLAEGYEVMFAGEPTLWDSDDYRTGANPVFTLPFKDERTREAFFHSTTDEDDYYDSYPAGVEERLNSGYFEWENGFTFEWFDR